MIPGLTSHGSAL